jgi:hypothetical protein
METYCFGAVALGGSFLAYEVECASEDHARSLLQNLDELAQLILDGGADLDEAALARYDDDTERSLWIDRVTGEGCGVFLLEGNCLSNLEYTGWVLDLMVANELMRWPFSLQRKKASKVTTIVCGGHTLVVGSSTEEGIESTWSPSSNLTLAKKLADDLSKQFAIELTVSKVDRAPNTTAYQWYYVGEDRLRADLSYLSLPMYSRDEPESLALTRSCLLARRAIGRDIAELDSTPD